MVSVVDAAPDRWADLAEVMGTRGDPSRCWCQYFRHDGNYLARTPETNRAALRRQVGAAPGPSGVLAYAEGHPIGWCDVGPRAGYPRLARMPASQATADEDGLWAVVCFVVRVGHRRQGVAHALLAGAIDLARRQGARTLEAYPVDGAVRPGGGAAFYHGPLSLFDRAGFEQVARPSPSRAVVRLVLGR